MKVNMKIGTRILTGYGLALLVVGAVGIVAYRATTELVDSADWVTHTHKVKETLAQTLSSLKDAETGQRGFLLTGEERYLEPYTEALKVINGNMQELRELTADNPGSRRGSRHCSRWSPTSSRNWQRQLRCGGSTGIARRCQIVLTDRGKNLMDDIRRTIGEMDEEESGLLKQRDQQAKATALFSLQRPWFSAGLIVVVLVSVVGLLIQRSITRPLGVFMQFVEQVGQGDLTQKANISSADELGELGKGLDLMVIGLKNVAEQARFATNNLSSASAEI